jgi:hypothetical protein
MSSRMYAVFWALILVTAINAGCKSTDSNAPANAGNAPASSPMTPVTQTQPSPAQPVASAVKAKVDVCALLTTDDLKGVQGEAFTEAKRSDSRNGDFIVAQCYYALPTTMNSVVLNVTTATEGQGARSPKAFWEDTFGREEKGGREKEKERDKTKKDKPKEGEEDEEGAPPEKVSGLGDEAFWIASRVGGALYVLKKEQFFRISVGGAGDEKTKLKKSKTLAQQVLKRI